MIRDADGRIVWSLADHEFLSAGAPATANPSLWRNAQLNRPAGLFDVREGICQVRGHDMSNVTFVRSRSGWIVIDPLMSVECAAAALKLVNDHFRKRHGGDLPIVAVICTHSHIDHYGGVKGLFTAEQLAAKSFRVIAPEGFLHHAVSENIYAGNAMGRRASCQYGTLLAPDDRARRLVGCLGDVGRVLERARQDFARGEYQWVAEITNMLVFADPGSREARLPCADALEQPAARRSPARGATPASARRRSCATEPTRTSPRDPRAAPLTPCSR